MNPELEQTIIRIINHLNLKTGVIHNPAFPDTITKIEKLMKIGYVEKDFMDVINKKYNDWRGTKFEAYLRPSTLFGEKFENYLKDDKRISESRIAQLFSAVQKSKQSNWKLDKGRK
jgi:uncharacterized phage protein (TIGR02220 family)